MRPVLCIAGPTASGKSAWAVNIAKKFQGEIINADALQVYAPLRILSARPSTEEMEGIPHHLFGHIDGHKNYSAGHWLREVEPVILDCLARGKMPVLTGGTGLYFNALLKGLANIPNVPQSAHDEARTILEERGIHALRLKAESLDPDAAAKVLGDDPHRLLRIVSVAIGTGKALSVWRAETKPLLPVRFARRAVLMPDRADLYARINLRFDHMVAEGGLDEVKSLAAEGYSVDLPMMKAIGVGHLLQYINGELGLEKALELSKRDTRRFAKRQYTWFRGQAADWAIIHNEGEKAEFLENNTQNID